MRPIANDYPVPWCLSITFLRSYDLQERRNESKSWFRMQTHGGPRNIVLYGSPDLPIWGGEERKRLECMHIKNANF